jgi:hypothetical protein
MEDSAVLRELVPRGESEDVNGHELRSSRGAIRVFWPCDVASAWVVVGVWYCRVKRSTWIGQLRGEYWYSGWTRCGGQYWWEKVLCNEVALSRVRVFRVDAKAEQEHSDSP